MGASDLIKALPNLARRGPSTYAANTDTVVGGLGSDTLLTTTSGAVHAAGVRGVETFTLASAAANTLTLANANFLGVTGATIAVNGGGAGSSSRPALRHRSLSDPDSGRSALAAALHAPNRACTRQQIGMLNSEIR